MYFVNQHNFLAQQFSQSWKGLYIIQDISIFLWREKEKRVIGSNIPCQGADVAKTQPLTDIWSVSIYTYSSPANCIKWWLGIIKETSQMNLLYNFTVLCNRVSLYINVLFRYTKATHLEYPLGENNILTSINQPSPAYSLKKTHKLGNQYNLQNNIQYCICFFCSACQATSRQGVYVEREEQYFRIL